MSGADEMIRLDPASPLVEAVGASVREDWLEAADLWFEAARHQAGRPLAMVCGAQAALEAGLFDLAAYFRIGMEDRAAVPDFIAELLAASEPVRDARKRRHGRRLSGEAETGEAGSVDTLLDLRLSREAIHLVLTADPYRGNWVRAAPALARAYAALGAHAAFIALGETRAAEIADPGLDRKLARARRLEGLRAETPTAIVRQFQNDHPAGPVLSALLAHAAAPAL